MNAEMKSAKWLWGGIGLQLAVGFTVAYGVYTVGTLFTAPASLNIGAAIAGFAAILLMVVTVALMIRNTNQKMKAEQALKMSKKDCVVSR